MIPFLGSHSLSSDFIGTRVFHNADFYEALASSCPTFDTYRVNHHINNVAIHLLRVSGHIIDASYERKVFILLGSVIWYYGGVSFIWVQSSLPDLK